MFANSYQVRPSSKAVNMRSAVALLSLLLASAQAFYMPAQTRSPAVRPSFLGQRVATRQAAVARPNHLRASLEDIEKKLAEMVSNLIDCCIMRTAT